MIRDQNRDRAYKQLMRRPVHSQLSYEKITDWLGEVRGEVEEVAFATEDDDVIVEALDGDVDEAFEFKSAYSVLSAELDQFACDLEEWGAVPEYFDEFFVGMGKVESLDLYEPEIGDYQSITNRFTVRAYQDEASRRLMKLTKAQLLDTAGQCIRIAMAYVGLRKRYEDLEDSLMAVRGINHELLENIKEIEKAYEDVDYSEWKWRRLLEALPDECWLR